MYKQPTPRVEQTLRTSHFRERFVKARSLLASHFGQTFPFRLRFFASFVNDHFRGLTPLPPRPPVQKFVLIRVIRVRSPSPQNEKTKIPVNKVRLNLTFRTDRMNPGAAWEQDGGRSMAKGAVARSAAFRPPPLFSIELETRHLVSYGRREGIKETLPRTHKGV